VLGVNVVYLGKTKFDLLVVTDSAEAIKKMVPDFEKIKKFTKRGIIVTAKSDSPEYDYVNRFFAPAIGMTKSVTGSAHIPVLWGIILNKKTGRLSVSRSAARYRDREADRYQRQPKRSRCRGDEKESEQCCAMATQSPRIEEDMNVRIHQIISETGHELSPILAPASIRTIQCFIR
jgi:hypothetical protein